MITNLLKSVVVSVLFSFSFSLFAMESNEDGSSTKTRLLHKNVDIVHNNISATNTSETTDNGLTITHRSYQPSEDRNYNHENHPWGKELLDLVEKENQSLMEEINDEMEEIEEHQIVVEPIEGEKAAQDVETAMSLLDSILKEAEDVDDIIKDIKSGTYKNIFRLAQEARHKKMLFDGTKVSEEDDDFLPAPKPSESWKQFLKGLSVEVGKSFIRTLFPFRTVRRNVIWGASMAVLVPTVIAPTLQVVGIVAEETTRELTGQLTSQALRATGNMAIRLGTEAVRLSL